MPLRLRREYGIQLINKENLSGLNALVIAVAHNDFLELSYNDIESFFSDQDNKQKVLIDVKGIMDRNIYEDAGYQYWRL